MAVNQMGVETNSNTSLNIDNGIELTLEQRKTIYRARRGLKELDFYFSPYVKHAYLTADAAEQALFSELIAQEDPDLLDWFLYDATPPNAEWASLIAKIKRGATTTDQHG